MFVFWELFQSDSRRNKVINLQNSLISYIYKCFKREIRLNYNFFFCFCYSFPSLFCVVCVLKMCSGDTTESELCRVFSAYGNVKSTKIIVDRAGVSKGYGFVTFETELEASRLHDVKKL